MKRPLNKTRHIVNELGAHLPYSIFGVVIGIIISGILTFFATLSKRAALLPVASSELFHIFHPVHILLSAVVTTAMLWKHQKALLKAFVIGFLGSIGICGLSDIILPYLGGIMLGVNMHFHLCILDHPHLIIPFAITGVLTGFLVPSVIEKSTEFSHSMHVLVSSMASILYLISFGMTHWVDMVGWVFIVTIVAVMLPCCLSDIVFPLAFVEEGEIHAFAGSKLRPSGR